ncbi:MAG: transposase [Opitutaceae bacterium]|nr:transposase [Opitutaceae bacterium]
MERQAYNSDLENGEWELIKQHLKQGRTTRKGRPAKIPRRGIVNAVPYRMRTGCQWRNLPHDMPDREVVYKTCRSWINAGIWEGLHDAIQSKVRKKRQGTRAERLNN